MSDVVSYYERATEGFRRRLVAVGEDQWEAATPCADWSVRQLAGHVLGEQLWLPHLVAGQTIEEVGDRFEGDQLGADPTASWDAAAAAALAALEEEGALRRIVQLSFGDTTAEEYAWQVLGDTLIHTWDLARAIGAEERLDGDLLDAVEPMLEAMLEPMRAGGYLGPPLDAAPDADRQTRLLASLGRQA